VDSFGYTAQDLFDNQGRRLMVAEFLDTWFGCCLAQPADRDPPPLEAGIIAE
jgi:hypothetical protein